jgi:hypothetical protein
MAHRQDARDALVPLLSPAAAVENAVYHGIEPSSAPGVIAINIFLRRGEVHAISATLSRREAGTRVKQDGSGLTSASASPCISTPRQGLEQDEQENYEVHIRMPYRPAPDRSARKGWPSQGADRLDDEGAGGAACTLLDDCTGAVRFA